jgi:hypothetical protein
LNFYWNNDIFNLDLASPNKKIYQKQIFHNSIQIFHLEKLKKKYKILLFPIKKIKKIAIDEAAGAEENSLLNTLKGFIQNSNTRKSWYYNKKNQRAA